MGAVSDGGGQVLDLNARSPLAPGTKVDVRNRYQGTWVRGFEVAGDMFTPNGQIHNIDAKSEVLQ